jgi:hypothetical protein
MDKKTLLIIFAVTSILIIGGYIYNRFSKLNKKIDVLEKQLITLKLENTCQLPKKTTTNNNQNLSKKDLDRETLNSNTSSHTEVIETAINTNIIDKNQYQNLSEIENSVESSSTTTSGSITATRNEVLDLENQIKNVQEMIDNNEAENGVLNYDELDKNTTGRIDTILNDSDEYNNMLNSNKNNSSEFDDLENVPNENNSELNELIKQESLANNTIELFSGNIAENKSESNIQSLEELKSNSLELEDENIIEKNSNASFKEVNDQISDKQDIEISVIEKRFNVKQLKTICQSNNLPMSGNKKTLIERIIGNNLGNELENFNKPKLTENLTQ